MNVNKKGLKKLRKLETNAGDLVPPKQPVRGLMDVFGIPLVSAKPGLLKKLKKKPTLK